MSQSTFDVTIYTDGACSGNPGPGGWGAVLSAGERQKAISGFKLQTTNNEMELMAVLHALMALKVPGTSVAIYTDSELVIGWLSGSFKIKAPHIGVLVDQIKTIVEARYLALDLFHVKGHSGNPGNERANQLAQAEAQRAKRCL